MNNLTWTRTGRDERGWQATGANGRRYQIKMRRGFLLLPTTDAILRTLSYDTLEAAKEMAWGFECAARVDDRLRKGSAA